ncbi:MAG: M24 family metallopeptidase [Silanimonas sp.]
MSVEAHERTGAAYRREALLHAQAKTWEAVNAIGRRVAPGMRESEAKALAGDVLAELGYERRWHPNIVRVGANTRLTWKQPSPVDAVLGERDLFFVDLGAVWNGHEGDAGTTFVVGDDPAMHACAADCRTLWDRVASAWRELRPTGRELYAFAQREATAMGWVLNHEVKGHRVGDFPHAIHKAPDLGSIGHEPGDALWILEIQIRHPEREIGAFHEDLLAR